MFTCLLLFNKSPPFLKQIALVCSRICNLSRASGDMEKEMQPTPVFLPGESHGQRSLRGATAHGVPKSWTQLKQLSSSRDKSSLLHEEQLEQTDSRAGHSLLRQLTHSVYQLALHLAWVTWFFSAWASPELLWLPSNMVVGFQE